MNGNIKSILLAFLSVAVIAGCAGKNMKTEEISGGAQQQTDTSSSGDVQVVPDEKPATEEIKSEDLSSSNGKSGAGYVSLSPGDELTKIAEGSGKLYTIYFDFDNYSIREQDRDNLAKNAKWLGLNSGLKVVIEGHADERGEPEYNLALGDKRAVSVKKYLHDLGIDISRMTIISYGEEKPATNGHDEDAWSKNRRAEFVILN